jgi:hypothetical protein
MPGHQDQCSIATKEGQAAGSLRNTYLGDVVVRGRLVCLPCGNRASVGSGHTPLVSASTLNARCVVCSAHIYQSRLLLVLDKRKGLTVRSGLFFSGPYTTEEW